MGQRLSPQGTLDGGPAGKGGPRKGRGCGLALEGMVSWVLLPVLVRVGESG